MANHSKHAQSSTFTVPSKSSLVKITATIAAMGLLATGGIVSRNLYTSAERNTANQVTAFSVTSTIRARPCLLKWVSAPMVQPPISFMVRGVSLACSVRWCPLGFCRMHRRMASSNSLP